MTRTHAEIVRALAGAGYELPNAPAPIAAYTPAMVIGSFAFTSGQLPFVDGVLPMTGVVGTNEHCITTSDARDLAARCVVNALAALATELGDLGRVARVVKVTGFVASEPGFGGQSAVIDGASELLQVAFGDAGIHTRSAVGVAALPRNSPVEVEIIVAVQSQETERLVKS